MPPGSASCAPTGAGLEIGFFDRFEGSAPVFGSEDSNDNVILIQGGRECAAARICM